jgi:hypothetical protein
VLELSRAELQHRLVRALNEVILNETLRGFAAAGVVLDDAGRFAIAELGGTDRSLRRRPMSGAGRAASSARLCTLAATLQEA